MSPPLLGADFEDEKRGEKTDFGRGAGKKTVQGLSYSTVLPAAVLRVKYHPRSRKGTGMG